MAKPALGRGLGALLGGTASQVNPPVPPAPAIVPGPLTDGLDRVERIKLDRIRPSALQPRKDFAPEALKELADSIREQGVIQPLIVRQRNGQFELIAGERRWRAAQLAGLAEVPVIVREADDRSVLEMALIENLQRENLNPMEEALGYSELIERFSLRQEDVGTKVGKSRAVVANSLRLLKLPPDVQGFVRDGHISVGHAKVILGLSSLDMQKLAAERIIKKGLNVRQTEELVNQLGASERTGSGGATAVKSLRDSNVSDLETRLRERFGTKVQLKYRQGKGALEVHFFSDDELDRILQIVGVKVD
jgi:ParB family chromosome partitioning protein